MPVTVYCHICNKENQAEYNAESDLECIQCQSTFVEKVGQSGLSGFLEAGAEEASPLTSEMPSSGERAEASTNTAQSPSSPDGDAVIRRILDYPEGGRSPSSEELTNQLLGLRQQPRRILPTDVRRRVSANAAGPLRGGGADPLLTILAALGGINPALEGGGVRGLNGNVPQDTLADILHHILVNETSTPGVPPASEEDIEAITRVEVTPQNVEELGGTCHISQDEFEVGSKVARLKCGHAFCEEPIQKWLRMHNTCPVCRIPISEPIGDAYPPHPADNHEMSTGDLIDFDEET